MRRRIALGIVVSLGVAPPLRAQVDSAALREKSWVRPLASLFLPGTGQALSHQDRAAIYGAVELYELSRYDHANKASRFRFVRAKITLPESLARIRTECFLHPLAFRHPALRWNLLFVKIASTGEGRYLQLANIALPPGKLRKKCHQERVPNHY